MIAVLLELRFHKPFYCYSFIKSGNVVVYCITSEYESESLTEFTAKNSEEI